MKKVIFLLIVFPHLLFSQSKNDNDNKEQEVEQTFFYKPQFYIYANHHNNSGNNFLADGHDADFVGVGLQINFVKFHNVKFGLGWEYHNYEVTNYATLGNINNTDYFAVFGKFQYQWDILKHWSIEPYLGIGASRIEQSYLSSESDDFFGMNLYAGLNVTFKITPHISIFTGANYNNIRYRVNTNRQWEDYFNKINQTQILLGIIFSIYEN